jgi:hypothetical protein
VAIGHEICPTATHLRLRLACSTVNLNALRGPIWEVGALVRREGEFDSGTVVFVIECCRGLPEVDLRRLHIVVCETSVSAGGYGADGRGAGGALGGVDGGCSSEGSEREGEVEELHFGSSLGGSLG